MEEILIMGSVEKDFERLGIEFRETYKGADYGVCEVTKEELEVLCSETDDVYGAWEECGWRYCKGSNRGGVNAELNVNGEVLRCWFTPKKIDLDNIEENYEEDDYIPDYVDLLAYLCDEMGCSQPRNVCALTKDLAKYNNMKLSELFQKYQG